MLIQFTFKTSKKEVSILRVCDVIMQRFISDNFYNFDLKFNMKCMFLQLPEWF